MVTLNPKTRKWLVLGGGVLIVLYVAFGSSVWWAMQQPPETFGRVMSRMPGPVAFLMFPFETAWTHARAGTLNIGDTAPDFSLLKQDKTGNVRLADLIAQKQPVVLVFGSYT
jgi:hypothetical protein